MEIGITSLGMGTQPLDEVLRFAASTASEVMELNGRETVHDNLWVPPIDYKAIRRQLEAARIRATSLGGYSDFTSPDDEELEEQVKIFLGYCDVARQMRIPVVRAFAGDLAEGLTLERAYPRIVEGLSMVAERVNDWGILVGIENHGRLVNDGEVLASIVRDVDSSVVGITLVPFVPLNLVPGVLLLVSLNSASAVGDIVTVWWLFRKPKTALVQDDGDSVRIFNTATE